MRFFKELFDYIFSRNLKKFQIRDQSFFFLSFLNVIDTIQLSVGLCL